MKTPIPKTIILVCLFAVSSFVLSCKKKNEATVSKPVTYSSLNDFYLKNGVQSQFFKVNATTGGSFTTPQGTKVTINPNSFVDLNNNLITGTVTIEFKDIYKKSDMLMSEMPTMLGNGAPLVSGGEFFIRAEQINVPDTLALNLAEKNSITVQQPSSGQDSAMQAFVLDSATNAWVPPPPPVATHTDTLVNFTSTYVFSLYSFAHPVQRGTWCNSDDPSYFLAFKQTTLTVYPGFNMSDFNQNIDVYLIFKGINSMVHVYANGNLFPYTYAPQGLQCTVVAVGVKDNNVWASFTPVSVLANQSVTIPLSQISISDFKSKLTALDN